MTDASEHDLTLTEITSAIRKSWKKILAGAVMAGLAGYGVALLMAPVYTAKTTFIMPQQQQNSAMAALSSLGALTGIGGTSSAKGSADQYVAIMGSVTVGDRMLDRFKLVDLYEAKFRTDARKILESNSRFTVGKKDNIIAIEVDDETPQRAAEMANAYVDELRKVTATLALTEAQQRRVFFDEQLVKTKAALIAAQITLQKTGFNAGAIKSQPAAAAEAYARVKAEIVTNEVRLEALRRSLTDNSPEVQQLQAGLSRLREQLKQYESPATDSSNQDYISALRDFKYQEALFENYAKQLELAKLDEARDGTLIQVLDPATPPERRSKPKRMIIGAVSGFAAGLILVVMAITRQRRRPVAP